MPALLIATAQLDCRLGDVDANCARLRLWAERARDAGARVVVFPEMMDTGYDMDVITRTASTWDTGAFPAIRQIGSDCNLYVICGLSERTDRGIHNAVAVIAPDGDLLFTYRKIHLFTGAPVHEERYLVPGDRIGVVDIEGFRWGIMVCYDIRFPEMARTMAVRGADVIAVPSAFPFPRLRHWNTLLAARAIENQIYVAAANRVGTDGPVSFCGASQILDPYGTVAASAPEVGETLITASLNADAIRDTRSELRVMEDRSPTVYGRKTDEASDRRGR